MNLKGKPGCLHTLILPPSPLVNPHALRRKCDINTEEQWQWRRSGVEEPPEGAGPFCCGVCQFEGRFCSEMAPAGAVQRMVDMYRRDFGFDFHSFQPAELFNRIRGAYPSP